MSEYDEDDDESDAQPAQRGSGLRYTLIAGAAWLLLMAVVLGSYAMADLPEIANLLTYSPRDDITLVDVKGRTIVRRGITQGKIVPVEDLPPYVGQAFIAIEDQRFYGHFGIDPVGLSRAMSANISQGAMVQGGSTITQQLAKNLFLTPERTLRRKIDEAILALQLEHRYSKDQILTLYLNRVYFGAGAYGIEAAAQRFFSKSADELTLMESAILAGSVKAPSRYNVATNVEAARMRASLVLSAMERESYIEEPEREAALAAKIQSAGGMATPGGGYFADYAMATVQVLIADKHDVDERLIVHTTLDLDAQAAAEQALDAALEADGERLGATQGALVAMTPGGALRALVGGRSYDDSTFNRAVSAYRQPGSAFKAFVYLAALEYGRTPNDPVYDGPVTIGKWTPDNYEGRYEGEITLAHALARSSNSVAVQLANEVGPSTVARLAHRLGITSRLDEVPALALGTSVVTPLELVTGYAAIANGGTGVVPHVVIKVTTVSGKLLYERRGSEFGRVMSETDNSDMTDMLMRTVNEGTGTAARLDDRPSAGKTGTSQAYRDAWFVGFSGNLVAGVWIGNDDNTPMKRATGGGAPARVFKAFMSEAEKNMPARPLAGTQHYVADNSYAPNEAPWGEAVADGEPQSLIDAFEDVLNGLF